MKMWTDYLTEKELSQLRKAKAKRDASADKYNAVRRLLKARCDSRIRQERVVQSRKS